MVGGVKLESWWASVGERSRRNINRTGRIRLLWMRIGTMHLIDLSRRPLLGRKTIRSIRTCPDRIVEVRERMRGGSQTEMWAGGR